MIIAVCFVVIFLVMAADGGAIVVAAPSSKGVTVHVDGTEKARLIGGEARKLSVKKGQRTVVLTTADGKQTTHSVNIKDRWKSLLLPVGQQCFAILDVAKHINGAGAATVIQQLGTSQPVLVSERVFLSKLDLPTTVKGNGTAELLVDLPCGAVQGDDRTTLMAAGYR